ncbi:T-cell activation inhibitor, mitochondrial isoform X4 [Kogia breviceps]|uniref:T-cell activation inhibitor, mitochondrial isoform X4 n=1 Tax=Kogia breviceps TaxID=27615 RepID=UPI0034D25E4E
MRSCLAQRTSAEPCERIDRPSSWYLVGGGAVINGCLEVDLHIYSEMFCHLRPVRRLCPGKIFPYCFLYSRALSGAEAVNALRPFYFAVHPDFFGQHPREREVNENSLKRLSAYLENLQKPGFKSLKPTQLMFYVRETDQNSSDGQEHFSTSGFRAVKFTLHTRDLLSTVLYILNSCSLSIEHIQSLNTNVHPQPLKEAKRISDRPIKWDKSYYSFTGFKDPDEHLEQVWRMETTLTSWLDNNGKSAVKKLKNSLPLRKELDRLKDELSHQLQLSDIRMHNNIYRPVRDECSGPCDAGNNGCPSSLDKSGIQVVYIEELQPVLTLEEYYSLLDVFYNRLLKSRIPFHPRSLRGLQMILNSDRYAPSLHELGHFNIPILCDPANLQWFILTKAQQARENMKRKEELKVIENELMQASTKKFSLEKFYKEPSVSSIQMVDCCKRLLEQSLPYLQGMHLCISHFYSVMQDGDLCIPWNWKNGEAIK